MNHQVNIPQKKGKVWLVGAGAGDEELLTLKGLAALKQADVVIYDALINRRILRHCPVSAEQIFVGKRIGVSCLTQSEINDLLVHKAQLRKNVVRLKGGDPFIFGRGGEEALAIREHGLEFEVIPGVTAALAASAYAGIPLTMRGTASSVTLVTGHDAEPLENSQDKANIEESKVDWVSLARGCDTLAIYMGLKNLALLVARIKSAGRAGQTPVAVILWGTWNTQQTIKGTLDNINELVQKTELLQKQETVNTLAPAALLIIGAVVELSGQLAWFENKPLKGLRVVITRSHEQKGNLYDRLNAAGANVIEFPTLEIKPVADTGPLDDALRRLSSYDWVIFSSVNTVQFVLRRLWDLGYDLRRLMHVKLAAIGRQTEQALKEYHLKADLVPPDYSSTGLLDAFKRFFKNRPQGLKKLSILFPGSCLLGDLLPTELIQLGAQVELVPVYENNLPAYTIEEFARCWSTLPELVVFTSSSTVIHLAQLLARYQKMDILSKLKAAVIGPVTAQTARSYGITVAVEAPIHTSDDLVAAVIEYYKNKSRTKVCC